MRWVSLAFLIGAIALALMAGGPGGCASTGTLSLGNYCEVAWERDASEARVTGAGSCKLPAGLASIVPHGTAALLHLSCTASSPWAASWMRGGDATQRLPPAD
ncbi:MAG: hypothetical protein AMXMBFR77_27870 [Phycisphaerales bacterium]